MDINSIFPFGSNNAFPDNGLITQSYDSRVTQNDMREISSHLLKQGEAFHREEMLDGSGKYTWSADFIAGIDSAFSTGVLPNFTKSERILFDDYISFANEVIKTIPHENVLQLDLYLGSR